MKKRILALDVGDKRIGIALSDQLHLTAQGLETYVRGTDVEVDVHHIEEVCRAHDVAYIVCGLPRNMNGTIGPQAEKVMVFATLLHDRTGLEVVYEDERLTTVLAERALLEADLSRRKRRKVIDKMAAVTILQSHLDANARVRTDTGDE